MNAATSKAIQWTEQGYVPDVVIRHGIRQLIRQRLAELHDGDCETAGAITEAFVAAMNRAEIAPLPHKANEQHYEVPAEFFELALGTHRKYSSCYWPAEVGTLDQAEAEALRVTCERAVVINFV